MLSDEDLDQLEDALKKATPGRWAMFMHEGEVSLHPAMRPGIIAEHMSEEDAMLVHLLKWHAAKLISLARAVNLIDVDSKEY